MYDKAQSTPVSVARHGPPLPPSDLAMTLSLVDIALSGTPILITLPPAPGQNQDRSIICIPLPCGQENCVLHHDGVLPAWAAALLTEPLLARIGQSLGREMLIAENALPVERELHPAIVPGGMPGTEHIVFQCRVMREFMRRADLAAASDASVLLTGESGVGKELVARRIHALSGRSGNFVPVNLAGIPDDLFENEFLGHERGAFTGAWHQKRGLLELADNGTLFLDELAETSLRVQVKLLRLLQERSFLRLGGTRVIRSNFRLVAATNRNLEQAVRRGAFREDLYYRINVAELRLPPLRERGDDILLLARHLLEQHARSMGRARLSLAPATRQCLLAYDWPGNVRELNNEMERAAALALEDVIRPSDLSARVLAALAGSGGIGVPEDIRLTSDPEAYLPEETLNLDEAERLLVRRALEASGGNKSRAAEMLGITREGLRKKLIRFGIRPDMEKDGEPGGEA